MKSSKQHPTKSRFCGGVSDRQQTVGFEQCPALNPKPIDAANPWVNRFDGPKQTRANRLDQMRDQLEHSDKMARQQPTNLVDSIKEGE